MTIVLSMVRYASGLDNMYMLTMNNERIYKLRVDLSVDTGYSHYAEYSQFSVNDEAENYRILLGLYSGTAGNVSTKLIWVAKTAITTISELGHWHPNLVSRNKHFMSEKLGLNFEVLGGYCITFVALDLVSPG